MKKGKLGPGKLSKDSYEWALNHLQLQGDTDLFPIPREIMAFCENKEDLLPKLQKIDISHYQWGGGRRFVVPKGELSFRTVTQLDPMDGIVLAALIKEYGHVLELSRVPVRKKAVFSHRFQPQKNGRLYGETTGWHQFWERSKEYAERSRCKYVAVADIADFYNQIYHHTLENELSEAKLPNNALKSIKTLVQTLTSNVSRGLPIGPHPMHLLAECSLSPVDRRLDAEKRQYVRYVDDFHFFCKSKEDAQISIYELASILDKQQKLTLQGKKTAVVAKEEFIEIANSNLINQPLNNMEKEILEAIEECTGGDWYETVTLEKLSEEALENVSEENVSELFDEYLEQGQPAYFRIAWLLRRLAQVGAPGALEYVIKHVDRMTPILGDVARYIVRVCPAYQGDKKRLGRMVLNALRKHHLVKKNAYLQMILVNMFVDVVEFNNANEIIGMFDQLAPEAQREIVFVAGVHRVKDWIREHKMSHHGSDPWMRRAWVYACSALPDDEAEVWIRKNRTKLNFVELVMAKKAFSHIMGVRIGDEISIGK